MVRSGFKLNETNKIMDFTEAYDDTSSSLGLAARLGNSKLVKELLLGGSSVNSHDNRGWTPLHEAASHGHEECVRLLVQADIEVDKVTFEGVTALYLAVEGHHEAGKSGTVQVLLQAGADPNMSHGDEWRRPLHIAVGNIELVRQLLDAGADPNSEDYESGSALHTAVTSSCNSEVQLLLDRGADVNSKTSHDEYTPLHFLLLQNVSSDILDTLIDRGADVNARDGNGITPLMLAVQKGWKHGVWKLLEHGADVNAVSSLGIVALHFAVEFSPLKESGKNTDYLERYKDDLIYNSDDTEIMERLLLLTSREVIFSRGENHSKTSCKYSIYHLGIQWNKFQCLRALLDANIPPDLFLQNSSSSAVDFADVGLFHQVPFVVDIGVESDTPLAFLLSKPLNQPVVDMAKYMIDKGSNVNAVNSNCFPPLVAAVRHQQATYREGSPSLEILQYLINKGADVMYKVRRTDLLPTALYVASLFNPAAFFQLLLSGVPVHLLYTHAKLKALTSLYAKDKFYEVYSMFQWRVISWLHIVNLFIPQLPLETRLMFEKEGIVNDPKLKEAWVSLDNLIGSPKNLQQLCVLSVRRALAEARGWQHLQAILHELIVHVALPHTVMNLLHFKQISMESLFHAPSSRSMLLYSTPDLDTDDGESSSSLVASSIDSQAWVHEMDDDSDHHHPGEEHNQDD